MILNSLLVFYYVLDLCKVSLLYKCKSCLLSCKSLEPIGYIYIQVSYFFWLGKTKIVSLKTFMVSKPS